MRESTDVPRDGEKECVRRSALRLREPGGRRNTRAGVLSFEPGEAFLRIGLRSGSGRRVPAGLADGKSNAVGMRTEAFTGGRPDIPLQEGRRTVLRDAGGTESGLRPGAAMVENGKPRRDNILASGVCATDEDHLRKEIKRWN